MKKDDDYTVEECLRYDGFDNVAECGMSSQEYSELVRTRSEQTDSERVCIFFQGMSRLSNDAKAIIKLVLNPPRVLDGQQLTKSLFWEYLRLRNWKRATVRKACEEIEIFLKKVGQS